MKLFWRNCDYNLILEKILDSKCFSSNSKSLLLSMIYKLEDFYKDYEKVKNIDTSKDEFLNQILDTIKKYCDNIKLVEPNEDSILSENGVLAVTNETERSILCYPTEISLLYAIADIMPKYFFVDNNFEYKNSLQRLLVNGYNLNILEILSDFNGWSWESTIKRKKYFQDNLIYQNFVIMFGNSFMEEWKNRKDSEIQGLNNIKKCFSKTNYYEYLCNYLTLGLTEKEKSKIDKELILKTKELEEISDKINYFEKIKKTKLKYLKELKNITIALNNKEILRKEYMSKNLKLSSEKRIATLGTYKKIIEKRKDYITEKITELSSKMNPINYLNNKKELENFIDTNSKKYDKEDILIMLQKEFIKALKDACINTEDIDSLKNLVFKIRYYKYLYVTNDKKVKDIKELDYEINNILMILVQKIIDNEKIRKISNDKILNQKIVANILETKVIDLESLRYEVHLKDNYIQIKTYEKEVFEKEFEIDGKILKKNLMIRQDKKYKLFI